MKFPEVHEKLCALCAEYRCDKTVIPILLAMVEMAPDKDRALKMIEDEMKRRGAKEK